MARLRKFSAYRRLERPYTRISRLRKKSYIKATPRVNIVRFTMGDPTKKFACKLDLCSKEPIQIRHNAIESARMTCNRLLEFKLGKNGYHLKIRIYPFHILRENPLASGAGADRMSTGMKKAFGKPVSNAARVRKGQAVFSLGVSKPDIKVGRLALKRASYKLPCACAIKFSEDK